MHGLVLLLATAIGQYYYPAAPTNTYTETLGAIETVWIPSYNAYCKAQPILSGNLTGQYRVLEVLQATIPVKSKAEQLQEAQRDTKAAAELLLAKVSTLAKIIATPDPTKPEFTQDESVPGEKPAQTKLGKPVGEKVGEETLGPTVTINLAGHGDCEARPILAGPETGKYQIVRQLTPPGDPYGFIGWLNQTRASYGLGPVGYDQNLSNWAAMNNDQQVARGMGHFVMGPARRQNAAMGAADAASVGAMWMASPGHQAALLDPTISWIGIAAAGAYWTFNAN